MLNQCIPYTSLSFSTLSLSFPGDFVLLQGLPVILWVVNIALPKTHTNKLFRNSLSVLALSRTEHCIFVRNTPSLYNRPPSLNLNKKNYNKED